MDQVTLIPATKTCVQLEADPYHFLQEQRIYMLVIYAEPGDRVKRCFPKGAILLWILS